MPTHTVVLHNVRSTCINDSQQRAVQ